MLTSDTSKTLNMMMMVTTIPNMSCRKGLFFSLGSESAMSPHEVYVMDELEFRSLIGVIEILEDLWTMY